MARANDEMDILGGGDEDTSSAPDMGAAPPAPGEDEEATIEVKQTDLSSIKGALSQAMALMQQYIPDEEEGEGQESSELGPEDIEEPNDNTQTSGGGGASSLFGGRNRSTTRGL